MNKFELYKSIILGVKFSNIHDKVSKNNLLVDSYIINTMNVVSSNNYFVQSSMSGPKDLNVTLDEELIEDSVCK